jgi:hypothetical protein
VLPQPPANLHMGSTAQAVFTTGQVIPIIVLGAIAVRLWRRERDAVPLLLILGGAAAMLCEPIVDVMGLCYFPRAGQWRLFEAFGRPIPWFILVYVWYVGGQSLIALRRLERGATARDVWRLFGIFAALDVIVETPGLYMHLYTYYGKQPFNPFRLPLWWPVVNGAMPIVCATLIYLLRPRLHGWAILAVVPLVPMADALTNAAAGWPIWVTLNTRLGYAWTYPAGLITCLLAVMVVWIAGLAASGGLTAPLRAETGVAARGAVQPVAV